MTHFDLIVTRFWPNNPCLVPTDPLWHWKPILLLHSASLTWHITHSYTTSSTSNCTQSTFQPTQLHNLTHNYSYQYNSTCYTWFACFHFCCTIISLHITKYHIGRVEHGTHIHFTTLNHTYHFLHEFHTFVLWCDTAQPAYSLKYNFYKFLAAFCHYRLQKNLYVTYIASVHFNILFTSWTGWLIFLPDLTLTRLTTD